MDPTRRTLLLAVGATGALAGCLGDDDDDDPAPVDDTDDADDTPPPADDTDDDDAEPPAETIRVSDHPEFGDIFVDGEGFTLYNFDIDVQGSGASQCDEDCLASWPALTVEDNPIIGLGIDAEITTFEREDGSTQLAANGWPLYYWIGDDAEGDVAGHGVNEVWWVMDPAGNPIRPAVDGENVRVSHESAFGEILVGADGRTLYMFDADEQGAGESACHDQCRDNWPPLLVDDEPIAGHGVMAELSAFERADDGTQVAADGWPLYYWVGDEEEGDTTGQGVNDVWWVLDRWGNPIREEEPTEDTGTGMDDY